jgi:hypothetical protein
VLANKTGERESDLYMKTPNYYRIVFLCFALTGVLVVGCKKKESQAEAGVNPQKSIAQLNAIPKATLTIKGFSIGMAEDKARSALNDLGLKNMVLETNYNWLQRDGTTSSNCDRFGDGGSFILLTYSNARKLIQMDIKGAVVDKLFNVADLNLNEFAQMFVNEYHLPEMKASPENIYFGYKYRDEDQGYELYIYTEERFVRYNADKWVRFRAIPKASERKFN